VLKLYALPAAIERDLLDVFAQWERVGVPFRQMNYYPETFRAAIHFSAFRRFEQDWPRTNRERGLLIDKNISGTLNETERARLDLLQLYADYHIHAVAPRPTHMLDELEKRLFSGQLDGADQR
jgi:hypothetical protein